eukprot:355061-Chlamydomonas_euryale.AAC.3
MKYEWVEETFSSQPAPPTPAATCAPASAKEKREAPAEPCREHPRALQSTGMLAVQSTACTLACGVGQPCRFVPRTTKVCQPRPEHLSSSI